MIYLKCNNCGHLNKLKTEYQVFCFDCKNKLDNNYSDWKRKNSGKSFEDFKRIECISEEEINNAKLQKQPAKKKSLKYWLGFALTVAIFTILGKFGNYALSGFFNEAKYDQAMMEAASQINESCPITVDSETRLDNAIALPNNVFQYNYTLVNLLKADVDIEAAKSELEPGIVNFVKSNPDMKFQREFKATINYFYKDKAGEHLFTVSVTPDKYAKEQ